MNIVDIKEKDIFHWSYTDVYISKIQYNTDIYWCQSRICIAREKKLYNLQTDKYDLKEIILEDTYWSTDKAYFRLKDIGESIDIEYLGNLDELEELKDEERFYSNLVDLRHSNSSSRNIYIKKGQKRDITKVREAMEYQIGELQREIESKEWRLKRAKEQLANLNEETVNKVYL